MSYLLDVNVLVALLWPSHIHHAAVEQWRTGLGERSMVLCPLTELAFLRVSCSPAFNARLADARRALEDFARSEWAAWIPADRSTLQDASADRASQLADVYLANLAEAHGLKLATFDHAIKHPAVHLLKDAPGQAGAGEPVPGNEAAQR